MLAHPAGAVPRAADQAWTVSRASTGSLTISQRTMTNTVTRPTPEASTKWPA